MNVIVRRNVFTPVLTEALRQLLSREELFQPATVTGDASWRSGRVAHVEHLLEGRLAAEAILYEFHRDFSMSVRAQLNMDDFVPSRCEVQLSSYGDGDYFHMHNDSGTPDAADRKISWVSYFDLASPRLWTGGELHVGDDATIIPAEGDTVFFPSDAMHAIQPVSSPTTAWINRRFSVNGWIR